MSNGPSAPPPPFPRKLLLGTAILTFAMFVFASPGRLDTIDAMPRAEVAANLVTLGRPEITDPRLFDHPVVSNNGEWYYSPYSAPPSLFGAVTVAMGRAAFGGSPSRDILYFLLATAALASAGMVLLLDICRRLGVQAPAALATCVVTAGATLFLPYGGSAFDQAQHAAVAMGAVWATVRALQSPAGAAWFVPGLFVGLGLAYREVHGIWILGPMAAAASALSGRTRLAALVKLAAGLVPGVALVLVWNIWRTGSVMPPGVADAGHQLFGNPLVGLLGLTLSPGKGLLWYSPPVLLGLLGLRGLFRQHRAAALTIVGVAAPHTAVYACFTFFGGDWCWGPRYMLVPAVVLMAAAPWCALPSYARRGVIALGLVVQLLALGRDYAFYIFDHRLPINFQYAHPDVYFTGSALLARPAEVAEVFLLGLPSEVDRFSSGFDASMVTGANMYGGAPSVGTDWMRRSAVYWLPTPWWAWMPLVPEPQQPYPPGAALGFVGALAVGGALLLRRASTSS
jgi:hypothetical protein